MILFDIEKCLKDYATWRVGSATSKAGLWDIIADQQPRILLIDEIDKMGTTDTAALLSLMEKGRLVRTKMGRKLDVTLNVWVLRVQIVFTRCHLELISRFKVYNIKSTTA
jgi:Holliday junction DNA helicase RuvB